MNCYAFISMVDFTHFCSACPVQCRTPPNHQMSLQPQREKAALSNIWGFWIWRRGRRRWWLLSPSHEICAIEDDPNRRGDQGRAFQLGSQFCSTWLHTGRLWGGNIRTQQRQNRLPGPQEPECSSVRPLNRNCSAAAQRRRKRRAHQLSSFTKAFSQKKTWPTTQVGWRWKQQQGWQRTVR